MGGSVSAIRYICQSDPSDAVRAKYVVKRAGIITSTVLLIMYGVFFILSFAQGIDSPFYYMIRGSSETTVIMSILIVLFGCDLLSALWVFQQPFAGPLLACAVSNALTVVVYTIREILTIVRLEELSNEGVHLPPSAIYTSVLLLVLILVLKGSVAVALGLMWHRVSSGVLVMANAQGQTMPMVEVRGN